MTWDKDKPAAGTSLRSSNPQLLANQEALEAAADREHEFSTGGTTADQLHHKKGSARCFIQDAAPTTRVDGTAFTAEDNGSLWIDTNSDPVNQLNILTDYSVPTWTPVSTEVIDTLLAAARTFAEVITFEKAPVIEKPPTFTEGLVGPSTHVLGRNEADDGNVDLIRAGRNEADDADVPQVPDAARLASNAAPTEDTQLPNKKYVDDQLAFSAYTNQDSDGNTMLKAHAYKAQTDGFVTCYHSITTATTFKAYVGTTSDPEGAGDLIQYISGHASTMRTFMFPVAKDEYFEVTASNAPAVTIRWKSRGPLSKPIDQN